MYNIMSENAVIKIDGDASGFIAATEESKKAASGMSEALQGAVGGSTGEAVKGLKGMDQEGRKACKRLNAGLINMSATITGVGAAINGLRAGWGKFSAMLAAMDDPYMQARASDVRAISDRMLRILTGRGAVPPVSFSPSILVSTEFAPSQIITLDRSCILGFIAMRGSVQSHAAALSRALSIPALVKLDLSASLEGHTALLDGGAQKLYVDPTPDILSRLGPPDPSIRLSTPNQL